MIIFQKKQKERLRNLLGNVQREYFNLEQQYVEIDNEKRNGFTYYGNEGYKLRYCD